MKTNRTLADTALRAAHDALALRGPGRDGQPFPIRTAEGGQYMSPARQRLADAALEELRKAGIDLDANSLAARVRTRVAAILDEPGTTT